MYISFSEHCARVCVSVYVRIEKISQKSSFCPKDNVLRYIHLYPMLPDQNQKGNNHDQVLNIF